MQPARLSRNDERKPQSKLDLVPQSPGTTEPSKPREPEQLPLIRMLEVVRDRVESIHAGQRLVTEELREIKTSLPVQRKPLSPRVQQLHVLAISRRRNGLCPCCQENPVCTESGRLAGAEYDHWYGRDQNRVTQTWLICSACNAKLRNTEFKFNARSSFEAYQAALRPFLNRQMGFTLSD